MADPTTGAIQQFSMGKVSNKKRSKTSESRRLSRRVQASVPVKQGFRIVFARPAWPRVKNQNRQMTV